MFHKPKKKTKIMESHTRTHTHTHTHTHTYNSRKLSEIKENLKLHVESTGNWPIMADSIL